MGSLKEILDSQGSDTERKKIQFRNMKDVLSGTRAYKIQMEGEWKGGKSAFCLSILNYLHFVKGLEPEEILMVWVDLDNGLIPLIEQGLVPEELIPCIEYYMCQDFMEVINSTGEGLDLLEAHTKEHGVEGAWLIIDNMGHAWEWTRDYYSRTVYDKSMQDLMIEAKQRSLDRAKAKGKKGGTVPVQEFDRMTDYAIINPLHNDWADRIKDSNINFVWTALLKYTERNIGNTKNMVPIPEGQRNNGARVDFVLRKKKDDDRFFGSMLGSRYSSNLFRDIEDMDFEKFVEELDKIMERERKIRNKKWEQKRKERKPRKKPSAKKKDKPKKEQSEEESKETEDKPEEEKPVKKEKPKKEEVAEEEDKKTEDEDDDDDDW